VGVTRPDGGWTFLATPWSEVPFLIAAGRGPVLVAAGAVTEAEVARLDPADVGAAAGAPAPGRPVRAGDLSAGPARIDVLRPARELAAGPEWFSRAEPVSFPTTGGATAHALFYAPVNPSVEAPAGGAPPLVVTVHGGPTSAARPSLSLAVQFWSTRGFAVVDVDYRGSTGYGRDYRRALDGEWGRADVDDCVAAVEHLALAGRIDPARVAIRGSSAGGYTVLRAVTSTDAFAVGVSYYGVADLEALVARTHKFEARYVDGLIGPWPGAADEYRRRSPIHHVDRLDTPLIVLQGREDAVVTPDQAEAIVGALRRRGIRHEYLVFDDEGHGFRRGANIRRALDAELAFVREVMGIGPA